MASISLLRYPNAASDISGGRSAWATPTNVEAIDSNYATNTVPVASTGGTYISDQLLTQQYPFNVPNTAVIDGIYVEIISNNIAGAVAQMLVGATIYKAGVDQVSGRTVTINNAGAQTITFGGPTDLWGLSLTASDINNSGFGIAITGQNQSSSQSAYFSIDAIRITLYYHLPPANVPTRYYYQVYNNGVYLGDLPNVVSEFQFNQDINTAGSQITVQCAISPDTAILPNNAILDESGNPLLDETGNPIYDAGTAPIMELGTASTGRVIRNGNRVIVTQVDYWNPNGVVIFRGMIQNWAAGYGGQNGSDGVQVLIYSDGADMDNHLVKGSPFTYTLDQSQTTSDTDLTVSYIQNKANTGNNFYGQTFTVGSGVTNIGAIALQIRIPSGYPACPVTVYLYDGPQLVTQLATVTQTISNTSYAVVQFNLPNSIQVTAGTQYFFYVGVPQGYEVVIGSKSTNPYSGGQAYVDSFGNGFVASFTPLSSGGADLYFSTYSSNGATTATYSNVDPTTGMLEPILNYYNQEGGIITYNSSSITATGLSISYHWNTNTIYDALQGTLSVSPNGYYYTVDLGTNVLTFKAASTTADITLIKGYHIDSMTLVATIEQIVNQVMMTGGMVSGSNIYTTDSDQKSISLFGVHLDRPTNNQILDKPTAHVVGQAEISAKKNEQYATKVTLAAHKIDFTTVKPGMTVGFAGFGTFVDQLILQIVRLEYTPSELTLTLGILPRRLHKAVEQTVRGYVGLQTVSNPQSPS